MTVFRIKIIPEDKIVKASSGENLKEALDKRLERQFPQNCSGKGRCGFCRVRFIGDAPQMTIRERELLGENSPYRLACMHRVADNYEISIPSMREWLGGKKVTRFKVSPNVKGYGIAGDLGTTSIALYLINLETGTVIEQTSFLNPQSVFGADVMSRLEYAKEDNSRIQLYQAVNRGVAEGVKLLLKRGKITPNEVITVIIAGNTAMTHLFLGWGGEGLEKIPFRSPLEGRGCIPFNPENIGLGWDCDCEFFPVLGSFIGGDTTAGILSVDLDKSSAARLLIDFGTNGEIVLAYEGAISACSTAAGPAFEGVGMKSGMPALKGAAHSFNETGEPIVFGGGKPVGICGSGYISGIARLLRENLMEPSGLLRKDENGDRKWTILPDNQNNSPVIDQDDIRKFQLAKGAIAAGIKILCEEAGVAYDNIEKIYLTGSFGNYIDPASAMETGLIPELDLGQIEVIDNAAGRGATLCLANPEVKARALNLQQTIKIINLGDHPKFQDTYVEQMTFPKLSGIMGH